MTPNILKKLSTISEIMKKPMKSKIKDEDKVWFKKHVYRDTNFLF